MTPMERVSHAARGEKPDKLPLMCAASNAFVCQNYGLSIDDYLGDADACTEASTRFIRDFEIDSSVVAPGYILYGCGPELGIEWTFTADQFPGFTRGPVQSEEDLERIRIPEEPSGYFAHYLRVIQGVHEDLGDTYDLVANILGPLSTACFLRGIDKALLDTAMNPSFFRKTMELSVDLSVYFGTHVLATGIRRATLNEIFLTPEMLSPDSYHRQVAPSDQAVREKLGPDRVANLMGAFMGAPGDPESQKGGRTLYRAFFGVDMSMDTLKEAARYRVPAMPFPVSISGDALNSRAVDDILRFLEEALAFCMEKQSVYPIIMLAAVPANSPEDARQVAHKLEAIIRFRDDYDL